MVALHTRRQTLTGLLVVIALALCLSACKKASTSYRYRMTVEVETPQGVRTGSSVIEVFGDEDFAGNLHHRVRGEGAPVTLPDGTILFALLRSPTDGEAANGYALAAFADRLPDIHTSEWYERERALRDLAGVAALPRRVYPTLVRFADRSDWRSVEALDPDHLGPGIRVRRILIEITRDRITNNVEPLLPPFLSSAEMDAWLTSLDRRDPRYLTGGDFRTVW